MRRSLVGCLIVAMACGISPAWGEGIYLGADVGVTEPANGNFRGQVDTGFTVSPYLGYMLTDYFGLQANPAFYFFSEEADLNPARRGNTGDTGTGREATTIFGFTAGPRLQYAFETDWGTWVPFIYTAGGYYVGTSGRASQSAPGAFAGGGLTYRITDQLSFGGFARFEYTFMGARPLRLDPGQVPEERDSDDIRWTSIGFALNYEFPQAEAPPEPVVAAVAPPPPTPVREDLPAPTRKKIVLRSVYFEFDRANIGADAAPVLDEAAGLLRDEGDIHIVAEGHTDNIGSDAYNERLGDRRAKAVRAYLINRGIQPRRIRTETYGEARPVATNDTAEGRAQNRRVELRVENGHP